MKYIFTARTPNSFWDDDKVTIDTFYPIPIAPELLDPEVVQASSEFGSTSMNKQYNDVEQVIWSIKLRLRFNNDMYPHVLMVSTDDDYEITREMLEAYLQSMSVVELKGFLEESRI